MMMKHNDETSFPYKLLLTDTQVLRFRNVFANSLSGNIKLSKTQLSKMAQLGEGITSLSFF